MDQAGTSSGVLHHENKGEWTLIGSLIEILNYPIDTGVGFTAPRANVWMIGMNSKHFAQMAFRPHRLYHFRMMDRCIIPYRRHKAALFDTRVAEIRHTTLINELDMARREGTARKLNYLGHPTFVFPINTAATQYHIDMSPDITTTLSCEFGYIYQSDRYDNFHGLVQRPTLPHEINNRYLANYSPFMLINDKSLDALKAETNREDLSRSTFRPNFVINAKTPYCEENISDLKIGPDVEFGDIIPCTHTFTTVNANGVESKDVLFESLQRNHSVNVRYPPRRASSWLPAFGINMQAKKLGKVAVGNEVFAKFHKDNDGKMKLYSDYAN